MERGASHGHIVQDFREGSVAQSSVEEFSGGSSETPSEVDPCSVRYLHELVDELRLLRQCFAGMPEQPQHALRQVCIEIDRVWASLCSPDDSSTQDDLSSTNSFSRQSSQDSSATQP
ncbi:unnamed protein product [Gongylonema pulchrum]|uniref:Uncharacterized protein n=1 Tax=Gongylonema pulchrum TaxID=637853 RepID=A0A183E0Q6_9BILA|nr:unnamed protein product [Gongylonema pulchrum]